MKFLADVMLGKLGRWLRMFGYDTFIARVEQPDNELLRIADKEKRIILTRDKSIKREGITYYVKSKNLEDQLKDIVSHFKLEINFPKETRCPICNGLLGRVERGPEGLETLESEMFWKCEDCGKYYWKGSHWNKILKTIEKVR